MNFDQPLVNWKKIARGLPRARKFALDRVPTIEEIRKLCEYPDRRIKAIIYTQCCHQESVLELLIPYNGNT